MFLTVPLPQGTFVVDPGFGSLAADVPVPLFDAAASPPSGASHWFVREGAYWVLRALRDGRVVDCWVTALEDDNPIDFVVANHYVATHPASGFRQRLMLRVLTPGGSIGVMNRDVTFREDGTTRSEVLADRAALRTLLREHFGFDFPEAETLVVPSIEAWR
jgi:N-hydroxyarylamine O-acetyltransferase